MNNTIEKTPDKEYYLEAIESILNNPNSKYIITGTIICYILNRIINSNYMFESTIDVNSKTLKFNISPNSAN